MIDPHVAAGFRRPIGGWWLTSGGAWAKGEGGRRYRLFHVHSTTAELYQERAAFAREQARIEAEWEKVGGYEAWRERQPWYAKAKEV